VWASLTCFALCAFVGVTILQEFVRGANVRKGATGTDVFTAMVGLVARSRRRYGGYIVHLGIVLMFLGFAGQGYKQDEQLLLKPGQQATVAGYTIVHNALTVTSDAQKQMITGDVTVRRDGKTIAQMYPAKWFFDRHESEPTSEVAIRRTPAEDLYIVLAGYDVSTQTATYAITINPLVDWIWFGFGVLAIGTGIALLPERAFAFATARLPAGAVTTGLVLLLLLLPVPARAQEAATTVAPVERNELIRQLEHELMCMCGGCLAPMHDCPMGVSCHGRREMLAKIEAYVGQGMTHDQIRAAMVAEYGERVLTSPPDRGFNRLAWLLPYVMGASGASVLGLVAWRWSRRETNSAQPAAEGQGDDALAERLEDELRDLD
jgi:cytochrome c-type biogenesis protein CcmF